MKVFVLAWKRSQTCQDLLDPLAEQGHLPNLGKLKARGGENAVRSSPR